jgi:hypothetical protein
MRFPMLTETCTLGISFHFRLESLCRKTWRSCAPVLWMGPDHIISAVPNRQAGLWFFVVLSACHVEPACRYVYVWNAISHVDWNLYFGNSLPVFLNHFGAPRFWYGINVQCAEMRRRAGYFLFLRARVLREEKWDNSVPQMQSYSLWQTQARAFVIQGRALVMALKSFWICKHCDFWMLRLSCFLQWWMSSWARSAGFPEERPNNGKRGILDGFQVQHILIVYYSLTLLHLIFDLHPFHLIRRITM